MTFDPSVLIPMVLRSIMNPREGASEVLGLGVPRAALWPALLLVVVLSSMLALITNTLVMAMGGETAVGILGNALFVGGMQLLILVFTVVAIDRIGRAMGGTGSFEEGLLLVTWLQFVMICVQVVQTVALLTVPLVGNLIGVAGFFLFLWMLTNFVAVLHGFRSLAQVFVMILVVSFGIIFALSIVFALLGIQLPGMEL